MRINESELEYAVHDFDGEVRDGFATIAAARDYIKAHDMGADWHVERYTGFNSVKSERVFDFEND